MVLPEPTDDREAFATRDRQNFMKRICLEGNEQAGFAHQRKRRRLIVKIQRAAGERIIQKYDERNPPDSQVIEIELMRVAVLVTNKEVAFFITQKLGTLALCQTRTKVVFQR